MPARGKHVLSSPGWRKFRTVARVSSRLRNPGCEKQRMPARVVRLALSNPGWRKRRVVARVASRLPSPGCEKQRVPARVSLLLSDPGWRKCRVIARASSRLWNPGYGKQRVPARVKHALQNPGWRKRRVVARADILCSTLAKRESFFQPGSAPLSNDTNVCQPGAKKRSAAGTAVGSTV